MNRIIYISHDAREPRGGVRVLYEHVAVLRRNGFDAYIAHTTPNFRCPFGPGDVPVLDASSKLYIGRDDFLVVPEDHRGAIKACRKAGGRKVLFVQNHYYILKGLAAGETWNEIGFSGYLCVSTPIQHALKTWFAIDAPIVRPAIDPVFFGGSDSRPASPIRIACMPRKGSRDIIDFVQRLLAASGGDKSAAYSWIEIDGMEPPQVAARMHESHVYLSTSRYEGLGLPPIEAMGAGCLVVGFTAGGGLDYASLENGIWVADDDPWALASALKQVINRLSDPNSRPALGAMVSAGRRTALKYSHAQFESDLVRYWAGWR